jgi:hypothetical protein
VDESMNSAWKRYRSLSPGERRDLLFGFVLIPATAVYVRLFGMQRWRRPAEERRRIDDENSGNSSFAKLAEARATARMIAAASRYGLARGNCLSQSIALWGLLRRRGMPAELRIGARRTGSGLEAHAWVELGSEIVNDAEDVRENYAAFEGPMTSQIAARK